MAYTMTRGRMIWLGCMLAYVVVGLVLKFLHPHVSPAVAAHVHQGMVWFNKPYVFPSLVGFLIALQGFRYFKRGRLSLGKFMLFLAVAIGVVAISFIHTPKRAQAIFDGQQASQQVKSVSS